MVEKKAASNPGKAFGIGYSDIAIQLMNSLDQPVRNPEDMLYRYREMVDTDETIGTGLEYLCYSVVSKMGAYAHENDRAKNLIDSCVENISGTIEEARKCLLADAIGFGFGVSEFTLGVSESQWLLSSLQTYDPTTLQFLFERAGDNSLRIKTVRQRAAGQDIDIPAGKCVVFRHGSGTNPYGRSRLRRCWRWYAFKKAIPKFWAVALERFGMPMLVGKASDTEAMEKALRDSYSKSYFAIGPEDSIEALSSDKGNGQGVGNSYEQAIEFCNRMMYRSLFLPSLLESGEKGGSYSLGQVHWRMFNDACLWLAREMAEAEIEGLWRPIVEWNLGPQKGYGEIPVADTGTPEEKEIMSKIFLNGVNGGFLYPDEGDAEWMRERLGFPEPPEGGDVTPWRSRLSPIRLPGGDGENPTGGNGPQV